MYKAKPVSILEYSKIFDKNRGINRNTVAAHERLEAELKKIGVEIKPRFGLEPPLGSSRNGCFNQEINARKSMATGGIRP